MALDFSYISVLEPAIELKINRSAMYGNKQKRKSGKSLTIVPNDSSVGVGVGCVTTTTPPPPCTGGVGTNDDVVSPPFSTAMVGLISSVG
mmetsp:Transcript_12450/g.14059  ORF Transcript_12450/g.14059 Transcript_12450/m.14059 type:complete len:90 (+) Transcript_12450:1129-1398(+)